MPKINEQKISFEIEKKKPSTYCITSYQNRKCSCMRKKKLNLYSTYQSFFYLHFSTKNWNTPMIFDLKEGNISLILQAEK